MKLDPKTISMLKSFCVINPSIVIKQGNVLQTISVSRTIIAKATVPFEFPRRFGIYNLSKFLGTLSLLADPELEFTNHSIKISDNVNTTVNITYTDEASVIVPPEKIKLPDPEAVVTLTEGNLKDVIKAAGMLSVPDIAIVSDGETISIQAFESKNPTSDTYSIAIGKSEKVFKAIFKTENLIKIIPSTYSVVLTKGISHFKSDDIEYWISVEASSTF